MWSAPRCGGFPVTSHLGTRRPVTEGPRVSVGRTTHVTLAGAFAPGPVSPALRWVTCLTLRVREAGGSWPPSAALCWRVHLTGTETSARRGHCSSGPRQGVRTPPQRGLAAGTPSARTPGRTAPGTGATTRSPRLPQAPLGAGSARSCPPGPTHRAPPTRAARAPRPPPAPRGQRPWGCDFACLNSWI